MSDKRFNLSLTEENTQYVKLLASTTGYSMTRTINNIIDAHRQENGQRLIDYVKRKMEQ